MDIQEGYKKCSRCGEVKILSDFSKDRSQRTGYKSACKECKKPTNRESYRDMLAERRVDSLKIEKILKSQIKIQSDISYILAFIEEQQVLLSNINDVVDCINSKKESICMHEYSQQDLAKDILLYVQGKMKDEGVYKFRATASDFVEIFNRKYSISEIQKALVKDLKMSSPKRQRYVNYCGKSKNSWPYIFYSNGMCEPPVAETSRCRNSGLSKKELEFLLTPIKYK